jgi:sugar (pentulose or hexulose) kinase
MGFLVIDIGTSSLRAVVVSNEGRIISLSRAPVKVDRPGPGRAEIDMEDLWGRVKKVVGLEMEKHRRMKIEAVGVGSILGYVFMDRHKKPLAPALIYMDNRAVMETEEILSNISPQRIHEITGRRISPELLGPKLMWLVRRQPELACRVDKVIGLKDEIVHRLTGQMSTDFSHANYTLLYNIEHRNYDPELLEICGLRAGLFLEPRPGQDLVGVIPHHVAREIGVPDGTPVAAGSSDGTAAMYGGGILNQKRAVLVSGTTDVLMVGSTVRPQNPEGHLTINNAFIPNYYLVGGAMGLSGGALNKIKSLLKSDINGQDPVLDSLTPGSNGLMFVPGLTGERAPYWQEYFTGALVGLTTEHTQSHIIRALMEGTCFRLRKLLKILKQNGLEPDGVNLTGGNCRDQSWNRIRARVMGVEAHGLAEVEATALGTAMFCRAGLDKTSSLNALAEKWVRTEEVYQPEPEEAAAYARLGLIFDQYLAASAKVMKSLREFR